MTTLAKTPYGALGIKDMLDSINKGVRLTPGALTPPGLDKVISLCWKEDPARRPRFNAIVPQLGAIRGAIAVVPERYLTLANIRDTNLSRPLAPTIHRIDALVEELNGRQPSASTHTSTSTSSSITVCSHAQLARVPNSNSNSNGSGSGAGETVVDDDYLVFNDVGAANSGTAADNARDDGAVVNPTYGSAAPPLASGSVNGSSNGSSSDYLQFNDVCKTAVVVVNPTFTLQTSTGISGGRDGDDGDGDGDGNAAPVISGYEYVDAAAAVAGADGGGASLSTLPPTAVSALSRHEYVEDVGGSGGDSGSGSGGGGGAVAGSLTLGQGGGQPCAPTTSQIVAIKGVGVDEARL